MKSQSVYERFVTNYSAQIALSSAASQPTCWRATLNAFPVIGRSRLSNDPNSFVKAALTQFKALFGPASKLNGSLTSKHDRMGLNVNPVGTIAPAAKLPRCGKLSGQTRPPFV